MRRPPVENSSSPPQPADKPSSQIAVPFNRPATTGNELGYIQQAIESRHLSGDGIFTKRCHQWLENRLGTAKALLTHSCTGALDMAALLADLKPGDEVIMPSYTFVSTANAAVLRGAVPVFVDIRPDTLNIDERLIEAAITGRTRAIFVVHYAGVGCEMGSILDIAARHRLLVVEDAAHGLLATWNGRQLGSIGNLAAVSFHETKNLLSGEGGALLVNDPAFCERAEIVREKGTDRSKFFRGEIDRYTWVDVGSSYLPSEVVAAFLWAQFEKADALTNNRIAAWERYHQAFEPLERRGVLRRPIVPGECRHNGHLYYLLLPNREKRDAAIEALKHLRVGAPFHYVPLHSSPAGRKFSRAEGDLPVTVDVSGRLLRLPIWSDIGNETDAVIAAVFRILS